MMAFCRANFILPGICFLSLTLSSCILPRNRRITRQGGTPAQKLQVSDQNTLLQEIVRVYDAVRDFNATVDMIPALGSAEKNKITEYKDVRAYILFRKPADIRIIGLFPVVRSKAFDMTSNGADFKLYIPSKNLFIRGKNDVVQPSANKLENLRPQHFIDAMLVRPVDPTKEKVLLENLTDEDEAVYILHAISEVNGHLHLDRTIWFNRVNLQIVRQIIFDSEGSILTDARYSEWRPYDNIAFPKHVEINRPRDEYAVVIDIVKMDINKDLSSDKFVLEQPEGSTLRVMGQTVPGQTSPGQAIQAPTSPGPAPAAKGKKTKK